MTLNRAIRDIVDNADESLSDGEVLDLILLELDKEHDEHEGQGRAVVGGNTLRKNYEAIEASLQLRDNNFGGML